MSKQIIPSPSKEYFSYIPRPLRGEGRVRVKHFLSLLTLIIRVWQSLFRLCHSRSSSVIPAKAGIHPLLSLPVTEGNAAISTGQLANRVTG